MIKTIKNIIKYAFNPLEKEQDRLLHKIREYKLDNYTFEKYRHTVKNNKNDSYESARNKLVRNCVLGKLIKKQADTDVYQYGNLEIWINHRYKEIYDIKNNQGYYSYMVDAKKKEWLDRELNINTYKVAKVG